MLRGDASRQHTLLLAGADRAKMLVVADDDPAMAHRVVGGGARSLNPTMRIVVRTRYIAEIEPLRAAGADRVIAEELESVVQLFADVMRSYDRRRRRSSPTRTRSAAAAIELCAKKREAADPGRIPKPGTGWTWNARSSCEPR